MRLQKLYVASPLILSNIQRHFDHLIIWSKEFQQSFILHSIMPVVRDEQFTQISTCSSPNFSWMKLPIWGEKIRPTLLKFDNYHYQFNQIGSSHISQDSKSFSWIPPPSFLFAPTEKPIGAYYSTESSFGRTFAIFWVGTTTKRWSGSSKANNNVSNISKWCSKDNTLRCEAHLLCSYFFIRFWNLEL